MGRTVRRVPPDWEHPKDEHGYLVLHDGLGDDLKSWHQQYAQWQRGFISEYPEGWQARKGNKYAEGCDDFSEWHGPCPDPADYMPDWPAEVRTHLQMYETTSEGTPISPVCETPEELARWLADNKASAFGNDSATYEQWLSTIKRGWSVSAIGVVGQGLVSGVQGLHEMEKESPNS